MKIPKDFKKEWPIHRAYILGFALLFLITAVVVLFKENRNLKMGIKDAEQTLTECQHSFDVWESQIKSGSIKELKRFSDGTEAIYRYELEVEPVTENWMLK